jgi:hypothetical protein
MLPLYYQGLQFAAVKSIPDLFKDKRLGKIKQIYDACKIIFKTGRDPEMEVCQSAEIYKILILEKSYKKIPIAEIVIIPGEKRVDLSDTNGLLAQWKSHKLEHKGYSPLLDSMGFDKNFVKLYNML